MRADESKPKQRTLGRVFFWLGAALLAVAVIRSTSVTEPEPTGPTDDRVGIRSVKIKTVDTHPANPNEPPVEPADLDLTAGEAISIEARDLPTERPLTLNLLLPAALPSADALPARIVAMDGSRELKLPDAVVAAARDRVELRIESGWLSPGRYLIELETTEPSHFAVRRYVIEVR